MPLPFGLEQLLPLLGLQNPAAAAQIAAPIAPPPPLPSAAGIGGAGNAAGTLGSLIPPAPALSPGPVQGPFPLPGNQGPITGVAPGNAGAILSQTIPVGAAVPRPTIDPGVDDDEIANTEVFNAQQEEADGISIQDRLKKGITGLAAVKRPKQNIPRIRAPRPPQGRGTGLPQGDSQVLQALQAALTSGAQTALPTLGSLLQRR